MISLSEFQILSIFVNSYYPISIPKQIDQGLDNKREQKMSVQELASRAASLAMAEAAKNISPPKTAYQFEVSWRGLSGDNALQATFLKVGH